MKQVPVICILFFTAKCASAQVTKQDPALANRPDVKKLLHSSHPHWHLQEPW